MTQDSETEGYSLPLPPELFAGLTLDDHAHLWTAISLGIATAMLKQADSRPSTYSGQEELMALREGFTEGLKEALAGYFQGNEVSVQKLEQLSRVWLCTQSAH